MSEKEPNVFAITEADDIEKGRKLLSRGEFARAFAVYNHIFDINPNNRETEAGFRTARFWLNRLPILHKHASSGSYLRELLRFWEQYESFAAQCSIATSMAYQATLDYVHRQISSYIPNRLELGDIWEQDIDALLKLGDICIRFRDYRSAADLLDRARAIKKDDPVVLGLLGEALCHLRNVKRGMTMLREAFFIDPDKVPLEIMTSEPVCHLCEEMKLAGIDPEDYKEWFPIFGSLYGMFELRRTLSMNQLDELKKNTVRLEEAYQRGVNTRSVLPRLLNHYFWLLDFYLLQEEDPSVVREILNRLKALEPRIYDILLEAYNL